MYIKMIRTRKFLPLLALIMCIGTAIPLSTQEAKTNEINEEIDEIVLPDEQASIPDEKEKPEEPEKLTAQDLTDRTINDIIVTGNKQVSTAAILNKIPYRKGQNFDPLKTRELIRNLYFDFKRFRTINLMADPIDPDMIDLHIIVEEKIPLKEDHF